MREAVLDASVVLNWFLPARRRRGEVGSAEAAVRKASRALRAEYEAGDLVVTAPPLLFLEIMNVVGRRWGWPPPALTRLAVSLEALTFELVEPDLAAVAGWVGRGLTAYDAAYVAVAEAGRMPLVTEDRSILDIAGDVAEPVGRPS